MRAAARSVGESPAIQGMLMPEAESAFLVHLSRCDPGLNLPEHPRGSCPPYRMVTRQNVRPGNFA